MSWDIDIHDSENGKLVVLHDKHNLRGGTYQIGGTREACLNITYNYGKFYHPLMERNGETGLSCLTGATVKEGIKIVSKALTKLEGQPSGNYWDTTEGNAKKALADLLQLFTLCSNKDFIYVS